MLPTKFRRNRPCVLGVKFKSYFQEGEDGGHRGFLIGTLLTIFDLQVALMLPTKVRVNLPWV